MIHIIIYTLLIGTTGYLLWLIYNVKKIKHEPPGYSPFTHWQGKLLTDSPATYQSDYFTKIEELANAIDHEEWSQKLIAVERGERSVWQDFVTFQNEEGSFLFSVQNTDGKIAGLMIPVGVLGNKHLTVKRQNAFYKRLIADLNHEIKTPLTLLMAPMTMLRKSDLSEQQLQLVNIMVKNSEQLVDMVDGMLTYARTRHSAGEQNSETFDVIDHLESVVDRFSFRAFEQNMNIEIQSVEEIKLFTDKQMLTIILNNLLNNAIKYGKVDSCIRIVCQQLRNEFVQVEVINEGDVLTNEQQVAMFNAFTRFDDRMNGSGIGLAISKEICENLGGNLKAFCESTRIKVALTLPLKPVNQLRASNNKPSLHETHTIS